MTSIALSPGRHVGSFIAALALGVLIALALALIGVSRTARERGWDFWGIGFEAWIYLSLFLPVAVAIALVCWGVLARTARVSTWGGYGIVYGSVFGAASVLVAVLFPWHGPLVVAAGLAISTGGGLIIGRFILRRGVERHPNR